MKNGPNPNPRERKLADQLNFGDCPHCGDRMAVIDSRASHKYRRRRTQCLTCHRRLTTTEITTEEYQRLLETEASAAMLRKRLSAFINPDLLKEN